MIKTIIADDEDSARGHIREILSRRSEFEIIGEATDGKEALEKAKALAPDVIFLDIDMPEMSGLEVAIELSNQKKLPQIVFVTAHEKYAVKAFEMHALDYIVKPLNPERVEKILHRLTTVSHAPEQYLTKLHSLEETLVKTGVLKKLVGRDRRSRDRTVIDPEDIDYIYADGKAVIAKGAGLELLLSLRLKDIAAQLDPAQFIQTHKAYLVNLSKIKCVSPVFNDRFQITLSDPQATKIPLSRTYAKGLKKLLGNW